MDRVQSRQAGASAGMGESGSSSDAPSGTDARQGRSAMCPASTRRGAPIHPLRVAAPSIRWRPGAALRPERAECSPPRCPSSLALASQYCAVRAFLRTPLPDRYASPSRWHAGASPCAAAARYRPAARTRSFLTQRPSA